MVNNWLAGRRAVGAKDQRENVRDWGKGDHFLEALRTLNIHIGIP